MGGLILIGGAPGVRCLGAKRAVSRAVTTCRRLPRTNGEPI